MRAMPQPILERPENSAEYRVPWGGGAGDRPAV